MRWLDGITDAINMNLGKPEDGEGQGGLACCSPWSCKELDMTGGLNNNNSWFTMLCGRNKHNIVKQIHSNKNGKLFFNL